MTAPLEGSRHLLLEGPVEPGANRWVLDLAGRPHDYTPHLRSCHGLAGLKTIPNPGRTPYTYLWTELPGETAVSLRLPADRPTWAEYYDGHTVHAQGGDLLVRLAWPRPWVRLWNVRAEEVEVANRLELAAAALAHAERVRERFPLSADTALPELLPAARAELASGLATDAAGSRLLAATRAHQDRYIEVSWPALVEQRRQWFAEQVGEGAGEIVVAAHAYVQGHLGGPWRDLADLCDVIECAPGVEFSLPLYDYAIAWEPGHSAWHMGRAFTLRFCGLNTYAGRRVVLHLHGYDYDRLGRACSVRFVAKALAGGLPVEVQRAWIMPAGPEGRDHPDSLLSLELPPEYLALEEFDITLLEGYLARAVDMRKQVAYSVPLSDVWVTVE